MGQSFEKQQVVRIAHRLNSVEIKRRENIQFELELQASDALVFFL